MGIRDKSLIASCKSLFVKRWEDKELSGKERGGGGSSPERGRRLRGGEMLPVPRGGSCAQVAVWLHHWDILDRSLLN